MRRSIAVQDLTRSFLCCLLISWFRLPCGCLLPVALPTKGLDVCLVKFGTTVGQGRNVVGFKYASEFWPVPGFAGLARPPVALENLASELAPLPVCAAPLYGRHLRSSRDVARNFRTFSMHILILILGGMVCHLIPGIGRNSTLLRC